MSKWTKYQWLVAVGFVVLIVLNNLLAEKIAVLFSFVAWWIAPSILVIFFTTIFIIWGVALLLLLQEKKGKPILVHKLWRIMPAIIGVLLFLSVVIFIWLGVTVLSDVSPGMHWILDITIVYFLSLFYFFVLSIFVRYSNIRTTQGKILTSANTAVLILLFVILFLPGIE